MPNMIYINHNDLFDRENSRAQSNFIMKCKDCRNNMNININNLKNLHTKEFYNDETEEYYDSGTVIIKIAEIECRACVLDEKLMKNPDVQIANAKNIIWDIETNDRIYENVSVEDVWCEYIEESQETYQI
mmetsp:Transcript_21773/g.18076  ORF Transcript_21773/g.18076 Transcript_21773/m.18076 type:complete len:130 (+) Transcript_21773:114-503(+)